MGNYSTPVSKLNEWVNVLSLKKKKKPTDHNDAETSKWILSSLFVTAAETHTKYRNNIRVTTRF